LRRGDRKTKRKSKQAPAPLGGEPNIAVTERDAPEASDGWLRLHLMQIQRAISQVGTGSFVGLYGLGNDEGPAVGRLCM
jgi:hypothetical protein